MCSFLKFSVLLIFVTYGRSVSLTKKYLQSPSQKVEETERIEDHSKRNEAITISDLSIDIIGDTVKTTVELNDTLTVKFQVLNKPDHNWIVPDHEFLKNSIVNYLNPNNNVSKSPPLKNDKTIDSKMINYEFKFKAVQKGLINLYFLEVSRGSGAIKGKKTLSLNIV